MVRGDGSSATGGRGRLSSTSRSDQIQCSVQLLDDSQFVRAVVKNAKGCDVLNAVLDHLDLVERAYFGLQYTDEDDQMRWLDVNKKLRKQMRRADPYILYFRVKFYVQDPAKLQEELTRYQFFLQVKSDILRNKLPVTEEMAVSLSAYAAQSELGDFDANIHTDGYLSEFRFVPNQTPELEQLISQAHQKLIGQTPADSEFYYLEKVKRLDLYGVDLHYARDQDDAELYLGVTALGIVVFANKQKINTFSWPKIRKISFKKKRFFIQIKHDDDSWFSDVIEFNLQSNRTCKAMWKTCVEHHSFFRLSEPTANTHKVVTMFRFGSKFRYSGRTQKQTEREGKTKQRNKEFTRSPSKRFQRRTVGAYAHYSKHHRQQVNEGTTDSSSPPDVSDAPGVSAIEGNGQTTLFAAAEESPLSEIVSKDVKVEESVKRTPSPPPPPVAPRPEPAMPEFTTDSPVSTDGLLYIKLEPDERGRFGFNVKGGLDQNLPVVVSKVAANTPAATVVPRIIDADQVLFINGTSVTDKAHEQVVQLIRETRNLNPCALDLIVKPATAIHWRIPNTEEHSRTAMEQLRVHIANKVIETQFEHLHRKTPGLTQKDGAKPENASKNRYLDILPYDHTRVVLQGEDDNNYINANFVNMDLPHTSEVNKYISSQGTLEHTVKDFWQMIWEQGIKLIVMLTKEYEDEHLKCFRYWPPVGETKNHGRLEVRCEEEEVEEICTMRQVLLRDAESGDTRLVEQLQYIAWPDHDTPDDCHEFLKFVQLIQQRRGHTEEPILVHCSAGVGRSGVFILVDTALSMLQASVAVYPLDLLRIMRDQRPMMIQTTDQYEFACTSILKAYDENLYQLPAAESEHADASDED
ncbi:tyrosine-protein phosphatase non-receptor type 4-like isoform X2 [Corticium candelabrum]|uniref:tyrosine-protein phosphatase non-receptor type 4-like isoform X2 n=1 Tax=Corticium candelabrum TaxID=121492 RepID=UPI002E264688|nr:tyrosine-protein phosphatase non-receptor type 4-like isoform X2 [Corticium candelabrum]